MRASAGWPYFKDIKREAAHLSMSAFAHDAFASQATLPHKVCVIHVRDVCVLAHPKLIVRADGGVRLDLTSSLRFLAVVLDAPV